MIAFGAWIRSRVFVLPDSNLLLAYAVIEITSFNSSCNKKPEIFVIWVVRHALYWSFGFRFARSALTRGDPGCRFVCHGLELSYYVRSTYLLRTFNVLTSFEVNAYYVRCSMTLAWVCTLITPTSASSFRLTTDDRRHYSRRTCYIRKLSSKNTYVFVISLKFRI